MDDSSIRSKTAPFSFENRLVWTGPWRATKTILKTTVTLIFFFLNPVAVFKRNDNAIRLDVSGHFVSWLDRSKSVRSKTHIHYSSLFHLLSSQTRLAEVANSSCLERPSCWLERADSEQSNHAVK